jgi:hypothetical protein
MINGRGHLQMFSHAYLDGALRGTDAFFIIIGFRRWHFGTPRQLYVRSRFSFFFSSSSLSLFRFWFACCDTVAGATS